MIVRWHRKICMHQRKAIKQYFPSFPYHTPPPPTVQDVWISADAIQGGVLLDIYVQQVSASSGMWLAGAKDCCKNDQAQVSYSDQTDKIESSEGLEWVLSISENFR